MAWAVVCMSACGKGGLQEGLEGIARRYDARIGVAVVADGKVVASVGDEARYPMMSVYKFHQAMAVAHAMGQEGISPDSLVYIPKESLHANTYSPLRDKHPQGEFYMTLGELLEYSLQLSDNNACDILFGLFGGPLATDRYIRSLGFDRFAVRHTEQEMHRDIALCHENWSSPSELALLMDKLFTAPGFCSPAFSYIKDVLRHCRTGADRIAAPLADTGAVIAHKTGTGDVGSDGRLVGVNDVAHIVLPDGSSYSIAVLIEGSAHDMAATSRIIAEISELALNKMQSERRKP